MTTKRERGRDPEQHVVHAGYAQANIYIGMHGQITGIADVIGDDPKAIVELRFHDGITPGGHMIPLIPAVLTPRSPLTFASVPPEFIVDSGQSLTINHELGYYPLVQVMNENGGILPMHELSVVDGPLVMLSGQASNGTNDHTHALSVIEYNPPIISYPNNYIVTHHDNENLTLVNMTDRPIVAILR